MSTAQRLFMSLTAVIVCSVGVGIHLALHEAGWAVLETILVGVNLYFVIKRVQELEARP